MGFLTGVVLGAAGGFWLAGQRATEPAVQPVDPAAPARRWDALNPTVLVVAVSYLAVGIVFGAMDVVVVGFTDAEGVPAFAGLALAVYAGGSLVAGLAYGVARMPGTLTSRFLGTAVLFGLAAQLLWGVGSLTVLIAAGFVAGLTIAPVLVSGLSLVESRVPRWALTEGAVLDDDGADAGRHRGVGRRRLGRGSLGRGVGVRRPRAGRRAGRRPGALRSTAAAPAGGICVRGFHPMKRRAWSDLLLGNPMRRQAARRRAAPPSDRKDHLWHQCPRSP